MPSPVPHPLRPLLLPSLLLTVASASFAQAAGETARPDPPSKLQYVSPLRGYKPYADQPVESWREANDRVGRLGGWRAYAKEIQTGVPAKDSAAVPPPAADPHAGHDGGKKR